jgi:hypothetical protein
MRLTLATAHAKHDATETKGHKMKSQVKTKRCTISSVMGTADFLAGMRDAASGKPILDQWESRTTKSVANEQWSYERGRLFYFWLKGKGLECRPIKEGRKVLLWAQHEFSEAYRAKAII